MLPGWGKAPLHPTVIEYSKVLSLLPLLQQQLPLLHPAQLPLPHHTAQLPLLHHAAELPLLHLAAAVAELPLLHPVAFQSYGRNINASAKRSLFEIR